MFYLPDIYIFVPKHTLSGNPLQSNRHVLSDLLCQPVEVLIYQINRVPPADDEDRKL